MLTNTRDGELLDQDTGTNIKKLQKEKGKIIYYSSYIIFDKINNALYIHSSYPVAWQV